MLPPNSPQIPEPRFSLILRIANELLTPPSLLYFASLARLFVVFSLFLFLDFLLRLTIPSSIRCPSFSLLFLSFFFSSTPNLLLHQQSIRPSTVSPLSGPPLLWSSDLAFRQEKKEHWFQIASVVLQFFLPSLSFWNGSIISTTPYLCSHFARRCKPNQFTFDDP